MTEAEESVTTKIVMEMREKLQLVDHGDYFPRERQEDEDIYFVEKVQDEIYVLCGNDKSLFYRKDLSSSKPLSFSHENMTMLNYKVYKDLWIWVP